MRRKDILIIRLILDCVRHCWLNFELGVFLLVVVETLADIDIWILYLFILVFRFINVGTHIL